MSSEVADVINKDRQSNLGFSTGANGTYAKVNWNASANGSFAFGQSTSNSNSEARTYAEDVTQRALERIVQKTSVTRTSKVLREFEENNKHGFDNREGENHVTGVYRWVDKVYKNRIVNYGKRLIYEFMVPEPAKFYKEAIIVQVEEDESTNAAVGNENVIAKPIHPKDNGIENSDSITRENYLEKSALYGADPAPPMDAVRNVSKPYSKSTDSKDEQTYEFPSGSLQVPELYHCVKITGVLLGNYRATSGHSAFLKIAAGGTWQITGLEGEGAIMTEGGGPFQ